MASTLHSPTILPRVASLFLALSYTTTLLLPVAGSPVPANSLISSADNPVIMPIIGKRGVFDSTTGAAIGGAIIVVVGVVIGLGCALIAVCGFPWRVMCARSSRVQDLDKGKEKDTTHAINTTAQVLPPPPPTPSPGPIITSPEGQYYRGPTPPPEALHLWNKLAVPGEAMPLPYGAGVTIASAMHHLDDLTRYPDYRERVYHATSRGIPGSSQIYGRELDDAVVEQQFHQHEAQPRGYI